MVQHSLAEDIQAILAAIVGGARYGVKIRIPHALVVTVLFRSDLTSRQKINSILSLAMEHASNLAMFSAIYKTTLAILKRASRYLLTAKTRLDGKSLGRTLLAMIVDGPSHHLPASLAPAGEPDRYYHAFISGCLGGYFVWGNYSSVNYQILLYLASRVFVGLTQRGWERLQDRRRQNRIDQRIQPGTATSAATSSLLSSVPESHAAYRWVAAAIWGIVMVLFEESPHVLHKSLRASMDEIYRYQLSDLSLDSNSAET